VLQEQTRTHGFGCPTHVTSLYCKHEERDKVVGNLVSFEDNHELSGDLFLGTILGLVGNTVAFVARSPIELPLVTDVCEKWCCSN